MRIKTRGTVTARERGAVPSERGRSEPPSGVRSGQRVKIQESAVRGAYGEIQPASHGETESLWIRTRGIADTAVDTSPDSGTRFSERLTVKTRGAYAQNVAPEQTSQAMERGRRKFQREQREKVAAKRFGERRAVPESPSVSGASPLSSDLLPVGRLPRVGTLRYSPEVKLSIRLSPAQRGRSRLLRPAQNRLAAQPVRESKPQSIAQNKC